jgi:hypothetical protein
MTILIGLVKNDQGDWVINPGMMQNDKTGRFTEFASAPSMRLLDAVKRGYDDIVEGFRDPVSGRLNLNQYGRAVNQVRAAYVKNLRDKFPEYGQALDAWGGPSQSLGALKAGQGFMNRESGEIEGYLSNLTPGDKEFYKLGAAQALRKVINKTGEEGNEARRLLTTDIRQKLRPLFDDDASYEKFLHSVDAENRMFKTNTDVMKGSQTQERAMADTSKSANAAYNMLAGLVKMKGGHPISGGRDLLRAGAYLLGGEDSALNAATARALTTPLSSGSEGIRMLQNFSRFAPATRNYLAPYLRQAYPFMAPVAGAQISNLAQTQGQ